MPGSPLRSPRAAFIGRRAPLAALLVAALALPASAVPGPLDATSHAPAATKKASKGKAKGKRKKPKRTVESELRRLRRAKDISGRDRNAWVRLYRDARSKVRRLDGNAKRQLQGVIDNTEQMAARRSITPSRAPAIFLTLQVNRDWWAVNSGAAWRPTVPGSPLVWQYYPGEGLQIQWLGTFGLANALATTKAPEKLEQLRAIGEEALRLASRRAGGPAWEYLFDFGGGKPPWGSGMAQVTGMQALIRTYERTVDERFRDTAVDAIQLVRRSAPSGARYKRSKGDHILLYTYTKMRVLNAFVQAVSGLQEVARKTQDPRVKGAFVRAERQLRAELPSYLTKDWARYSIGGKLESPDYHTVSRNFLRQLCQGLLADHASFAQGGPTAGWGAPVSPDLYCITGERFAEQLRETPNGPGAKGRATLRAPEPVAADALTGALGRIAQP
ncbi:MAG: D-glucuronyl C5-epimerase family protein [Solirubrobacteraceae bacterium]|nr:D-glucuronyl C5-epimerase family protein [Solirubrobacteraceae bacterium]